MAKEKSIVKKLEKPKDDAGKQKALEEAMKKLTKDFGTGIVMLLGEKPQMKIDTISTGSLLLDDALGVGGLPKGRIIEIYGPESSGKTTVSLHAVAEEQKKGGTVAFVDAEHALDPKYAAQLGVDIDKLLVSQPDSGEQALEVVLALVSSGAVSLIVIDSVAALTPRAEIEGDMGDSHVGLQARLMSQALRKLASIINNMDCTVIFINQLREKVGVIYGSPEVTPGGRALKFYASVRLDIRKGEAIKDGTDIIGNKVKIKVVKNKVAPPFKMVECEMMYGEGLSVVSELIDLAVKFEIIEKAGSWYAYQGDKIGQGKQNTKKYLLSNTDAYDEIHVLVKSRLQSVDISIDESETKEVPEVEE